MIQSIGLTTSARWRDFRSWVRFERCWSALSNQSLPIERLDVFSVLACPNGLSIVRDLEETEATIEANLAVPRVRPESFGKLKLNDSDVCV